jgi:hypothetical protein
MTGDRARAMAILAAVCLTLSCSDSSGPSGKISASVNDPSGDQFGSDSVQPDLVKLTVTRDTGGVDIALDLTVNAISLLTDTIHGVGGYIDLDTDQDSTTGVQTATDFYRPTGSGSTGMGEEFFVEFVVYAVDSTALVFNASNQVVGYVRPVFSGHRVSFRIPRSLLGNDDGFMNVAVAVGNNYEATDIAPNAGHIKVGGTGAVATYSPAAGLRPLRTREWGGRWSAQTPRR